MYFSETDREVDYDLLVLPKSRLCDIILAANLNSFIRTSPEVAYDRLKQRGRKEEAGVPMEFIQVKMLNKII